jgi:hypothetical protein
MHVKTFEQMFQHQYVSATHQCTFFVLVAFYSFANPYNDDVTHYKVLTSP